MAQERVARIAKQLAIPGIARTRERKRGKSPRKKEVLRMPATTLVGRADRRDREIRVSIHGNEVHIGIKTVGKMVGSADKQKQNVSANLSPSDARLLAEHLMKAAGSLSPERTNKSPQD